MAKNDRKMDKSVSKWDYNGNLEKNNAAIFKSSSLRLTQILKKETTPFSGPKSFLINGYQIERLLQEL